MSTFNIPLALATGSFSAGYLGAGIGPHFVLAKAHIDSLVSNVPIPDNPITATRNVSPDLGRLGFMGNAHLGYGHSFPNHFYLGIELFGERYSNYAHMSELRQIKVTAGTSNATTIISEKYQNKVSYDYGLSIRPGWQPSLRSLIYLSVGFAIGKLKSFHGINFLGNFFEIPSTIEKKDLQMGFRAGLGTSIRLLRHLAFRLEYLYTHYGQFELPKASFTLSQTSPPTRISISNTAKVSKHALILSLDYWF